MEECKDWMNFCGGDGFPSHCHGGVLVACNHCWFCNFNFESLPHVFVKTEASRNVQFVFKGMSLLPSSA